MAFVALRMFLLLLAGNFEASSQLHNDQLSGYKIPECYRYRLPGCPRDFNPVCGSDMTTYPNECTLCMKIREEGRDIKIIRDEAC